MVAPAGAPISEIDERVGWNISIDAGGNEGQEALLVDGHRSDRHQCRRRVHLGHGDSDGFGVRAGRASIVGYDHVERVHPWALRLGRRPGERSSDGDGCAGRLARQTEGQCVGRLVNIGRKGRERNHTGFGCGARSDRIQHRCLR